MALYLCEKPSQAKDIAKVIGATARKEGYFEGSGHQVTWAFGHLLEMASPEQCDKNWKRWDLNTLPMLPTVWPMKSKTESAKQFKIMTDLIRKASDIVISTDADREGEVIAREVMDACNYKGNVKRLWLSALDEASVKKALANMKDGSETEALYAAGLGRQRADWLIGMNMTRAYTLLAKSRGFDGVLSVGRVQTPTLNLVVMRDREIEDFKPKDFFELFATFTVASGRYNAKYQMPKSMLDEQGYCLDKGLLQRLQIKDQVGEAKATTTLKKEKAPLLPDLSFLQEVCSRKFGFSAKKTLDIAQSLYEKHKATTYPRTDCRYMPQSQFAEAASILSKLAQESAGSANPARKSRVWDDKKISAHHAIIPTGSKVNMSNMSADEQKLYELVCLHYIAQFYPDYSYNETIIQTSVAEHKFKTTGKTPVDIGWQAVIKGKKDAENTLPTVGQEPAKCLSVDVKAKNTKPPAQFTDGTLISAMKSVSKFMDDPALKRVLKDKTGIGTNATRANIIETLLNRGFLIKGKKFLTSSKPGRSLIDALPDDIKNPITTARWEQVLDSVSDGNVELDDFLKVQQKWLTQMIDNVKKGEVKMTIEGAKIEPCPDCGEPMKRIKSKKGKYFWVHTAEVACKTFIADNRGKLGDKIESARPTGDDCEKCGKPMVERKIGKGANKGKTFSACSGYPKCKHAIWPE